MTLCVALLALPSYLHASRLQPVRHPLPVICCQSSASIPDPAPSTSRRQRELSVEFGKIAVPALAQFTAEPFAGLVDAAYLGRLGASALGGAGIAISAHYATAKLLNDPLLRCSISIVASGDGAARRNVNATNARDQTISAALVLALVVGLLRAWATSRPLAIAPLGRGDRDPWPWRPVATEKVDCATPAWQRVSSCSLAPRCSLA